LRPERSAERIGRLDPMGDYSTLGSLGLMLVTAALCALAARRIRMPAIVAWIIAGLLLGPATGWVSLTPTLDGIASAGIVLLLFLVGLELSLERIRDVGATAIVAGLGQVLFTVVGGLLLCRWLGFDWMASLFIATGLTFSSTVVVVKLLEEKGELDSLYGRIAVGIFLVQDMVVILIMTFLAGLGQGDGETGWKVAAVGIGKAFGGMALLLAITLGAARWLLRRPFAWAARSPETNLVWSLGWCFLIVWLSHAFGLSHEIGAFLAGISLAQLPYSGDLRRRVAPLMSVFIAVFFVGLGVRLDTGGGPLNLMPVVVLSLFVLLGNPLIFIWIISKMGYSRRTSFKTSVTVAQISEFSFIFASMGVTMGLVGNEVLSITALVGILTIGISAYMILFSDQLYLWVRKRGLLNWVRASGPAEERKTKSHGLELEGHVIVVGMNSLGRELVRRLDHAGWPVLAIDTDPKKLEGLPGHGLLGDAESLALLNEARLDKARLLISTLHIEPANDLLAFRCKQAGVPAAIHAVDLDYIGHLLDMDTAFLMVPKVDGAKRQRKVLEELGFLKR
jgi:Kef-type K+ transport system membrane component KefB